MPSPAIRKQIVRNGNLARGPSHGDPTAMDTAALAWPPPGVRCQVSGVRVEPGPLPDARGDPPPHPERGRTVPAAPIRAASGRREMSYPRGVVQVSAQ